MDIYNLYLDESESFSNEATYRSFSIAGVAIEEKYHDTIVVNQLNVLKSSIWNDLPNPHSLIFHEKDIRYASNPCNKYTLKNIKPEYRRFKNGNNMKKLYNGLNNIIDNRNITIIGTGINQHELYTSYPKDLIPDRSFIALQIILENFCHFLKKNNAKGKIVYESVGYTEDRNMRMRYHQIKAMGSIYINPHSMQELLIGIDFYKKSENVAGLQIADFVPNDIVRSVLAKKQHKYNVNNAIKKQRYNGGIQRKDKFGIKILP